MTRNEIEQQFNISDEGFILNPGIYEACKLYAPHFMSLASQGKGETLDHKGFSFTLFEITQEDLKEFPELKGTSILAVYQDALGLCCLWENPDLNELNDDLPDDLFFDETY